MARLTGKSPPENEIFIFKKPMPAEGREMTYLGVAFENPVEGSLGRFTPQGPRKVKSDGNRGIDLLDATVEADIKAAELAELEDTETGAPATPHNDINAEVTAPTGSTEPELSNGTPQHEKPRRNVRPENISSYKTAGEWPKDLVDKIYPDDPIEAFGIQAIREKVTDSGLQATITDAIHAGLKRKVSHSNTTTIPFFRRWTMEDPWGRIDDLLDKTEYRQRLINLFERQDRAKKVLYVATSIISCGELSYNLAKDTEFNVKGGVKDPTNHAPVKIDGHWTDSKHNTLSGTYRTEVILGMAYRIIRYECIKDGGSNFIAKYIRGRRQTHDSKGAIQFDREDGFKDYFWIDNFEAEGQVPAWMGQDEDSTKNKSTAILEGASLHKSTDIELGIHDFPEGFFDPSVDEQPLS